MVKFLYMYISTLNLLRMLDFSVHTHVELERSKPIRFPGE